MNGKTTLWIDQYGSKYWSRTIRELCEQLGTKAHGRSMYIDGKDGKAYRTGVVIGSHWLTAYTPVRIPA
jgi:hypothetical protein